MDTRPEDEGTGLFPALGIGGGIAMGAGFGVALNNIVLGIGLGIATGVPLGTVVWISKHGDDGDG